MDARPQYRQAARSGLQQSQSGSGTPSSPAREKQRMLPPSTLAPVDLQDHIVGRHRQTAQAESKGTKPKDKGGVGHSGGSQSSGHHKRTNQGQKGSSAKSGPSRPTPLATTTSGTLAATSGHSKRQPGDWHRSMDNKVRYLFCWSIENYRLSTCLNPCEGLSNKILLNFFVYYREVCSKLTFQ